MIEALKNIGNLALVVYLIQVAIIATVLKYTKQIIDVIWMVVGTTVAFVLPVMGCYLLMRLIMMPLGA